MMSSTLSPSPASAEQDTPLEGGEPEAALTPSVTYLVSVLEQRVRSGHYRHGERLPAERALAVEFALSRPTIRLAIRELENRGLIRRLAGHRPVIWSQEDVTGRKAHSNGAATAAVATVLSPHNGIRSDTTGKRGDAIEAGKKRGRSVGLWISGNPTDPGPMAVTRSVYASLAEADLRLVIACPRSGPHDEVIRSEAEALERMARDEDIAGLVLWYLGDRENLPCLEALRAAGKTLVFVDREPPAGFEADLVGVYNEFAAADAVRHLITLGHRSIAHITSTDPASAVRERREGYLRALTEAGIVFRPELLLEQGEGGEEEEGERERVLWQTLAEHFLTLPGGHPTAAFAVNDYSARRFIVALQDRGVRVPEDVSVIGFDDSDRWKPGAVPALSSASQPFERIGAEAVRLLLYRLKHRGPQTYRHVLLPAPLVVRASTAPPAA